MTATAITPHLPANLKRVAIYLILFTPLPLIAQRSPEDRALARFVGGVVIYGFLLVVVLLVARGILLWYWKINSIERLLSEILATLRGAPAPRPGTPLEPAKFHPAVATGTGLHKRVSSAVAALSLVLLLALVIVIVVLLSK